MSKKEVILSNIKDLVKSCLPALEIVSPGLGTGLSCALAYYERQEQRNIEIFVASLGERIKDLELKDEEIRQRFERQASFIVEVLDQVKKEKAVEKIHFYAGAAAEVIRDDVTELELKQEFVSIIGGLSRTELIILEALEGASKRRSP